MFGNRGHSSRENRKPRALDLTLIVRSIEDKSYIIKCGFYSNPWFKVHLNAPHDQIVAVQVDGLVRRLDSFCRPLSRSYRKLFKGRKHCLLEAPDHVFSRLFANNISEYFREFVTSGKTSYGVKKC